MSSLFRNTKGVLFKVNTCLVWKGTTDKKLTKMSSVAAQEVFQFSVGAAKYAPSLLALPTHFTYENLGQRGIPQCILPWLGTAMAKSSTF